MSRNSSHEEKRAKERRRHPRAPLLTQVEAQGRDSFTLGRANDVSVGGLLIETPDTLEVGSTVVVRFFLPPEKAPLEAAGRIVRAEAGKLMAIAFLGLPEEARKRILEYTSTVEGSPDSAPVYELQPGVPRLRRSSRVPRRMSVVLSWQDAQGRPRQEAAETQSVSRYGARVMAFSEVAPGTLLRLSVPDTGKEGLSRVVWTTAGPLPGRAQMGIEVMGRDNLWGIEFPPDLPEETRGPKLARRRSARLPRRIDVLLSWVDEYGRVREEEGSTIMVSKFGAALIAYVELGVRQRFRFRVPAMGRETESRVVWAHPDDLPGRIALGVEFLGVEDFWCIDFPPDPGFPLPA